MSPYFHTRWYVDADGLLQRRTPADQDRVEALYEAHGIAWRDEDWDGPPVAALRPLGGAERR
jgi:hypothetical protein